ncbi:YiiX/YebB-like N1pC/P60 family cysteine hydrolase [Fluoribacter dumoffii]|uniref:Uncharacterized distant relative of cell wall-associated hydrolases n=1 Tax=Fluoribacter dumoffii TaxID=463 RepID=A0A377G7B5_9GAMM|nr:YiiX/YebB-like N1pC/P60 family cysteine hydrolase [Fluoribacter dumoffii]KTC89601.1 hypothetical protein Ldum_0669 [Fluoribacter dumoffii NY 23]MCW8384794.1 YiiX/YebB-like N1pC/P60 family cysteine hydrolase [Fluoribacter dumoffii]MCW8417857.1 YiiX/YebB-like N1pC/P60 family cysteine hydrolase [Fluoribacter dumoffii]MCW8454301.1 YiiX/YebB-like N1pC/P60 family cysteine hydrolase [Fluoribacter dumoffii]MCW8461625.1 YiiX/YebB-like N1pC/P60 family cysteine hydrolase [Fluoribacter dumoffii]
MDGFPQDNFPDVGASKYDHVRSSLHTGDLLFASGNSLMSAMIKGATNSVWSHIAFIVRLENIDRIMVMESVETIGVRTVPLSNYVRNYNGRGQGYPGRLLIARYQGFPTDSFANLSKQAVDLLGYPYNTEEILKIAARIGMNAFGFDNASPEVSSTHAFICSEYVSICYKSVGITIDYNSQGFIAPADFARSPKVIPMSYIDTE